MSWLLTYLLALVLVLVLLATPAWAASITAVHVTTVSLTREKVFQHEAVGWVVDVNIEDNEDTSTLNVSNEASELWVSVESDGEVLAKAALGLVQTHEANLTTTLTYTFDIAGAYPINAKLWRYWEAPELEDTMETVLLVEQAPVGCIEFYVTDGDVMAPGSTSTLQFAARFLRSSGETAMTGISDESLTTELIAMGERPHVFVNGEDDLSVARPATDVNDACEEQFNQTLDSGESGENHRCVRAKSTNNGWSIVIESQDWTGFSSIRVETQTSSSMNGNCGLSSTDVFISVVNSSDTFTQTNRTKSVLPAGLSLQNLERRVTSLATHTCIPSLAAAIVAQASTKIAESLLLSHDAFHSFSRFDFESENVLLDNELFCTSVNCSSLEIVELAFLDTEAIILTSSEGTFVANFANATVYFTKLQDAGWGIDGLENCRGESSSEAISLEHDMLALRAFLKRDNTIMEVMVKTTDSSVKAYSVVSFEDIVDIFRTSYEHELLSIVSSSLAPDFTLMLFKSQLAPYNIFVGKVCDTQSQVVDTISCTQIINQTSSSGYVPVLGYVFPDDTELQGMCIHTSGLAYFAYGDSLWASFDMASNFENILTLQPGEIIDQCPISSATRSVFIVKTSFGRLFMGKLHVKGMIEIYNHLGSDKLVALGGSNKAYWLRWSLNEELERFHIPLQAPFSTHVETSTNILDNVAWAITGTQGSRIALACVDMNSGQPMKACLGPQHEGMVIQPLKAQIYDVDLSTGIAYASTLSQTEMNNADIKSVLPCGLLLTTLSSFATACEGVRTAINISVVPSTDMEEDANECIENLSVGSTVTLSARYGSIVLFLTSSVQSGNAGSAYCIFGDPTNLVQGTATSFAVHQNHWSLLHTDQLWLDFPSCPLENVQITPAVLSPAIRLLDKYDMFSMRTSLSIQKMDSNRAVEMVYNDTILWKAWPTENKLRILQNQGNLVDIQIHYQTNASDDATSWSSKVATSTYETYQTVFPRHMHELEFSPNQLNAMMLVEPSADQPKVGLTTVLVSGTDVNLACDINAYESVFRIFVACPDGKELSYVPANGSSYVTLPTNYRPPSARGKGIPLTSNVYNADPSQRLYMDWFEVSRETAEFKQCANAITRAQCNCSSYDSLEDSEHSENVSDCITTVQRMLYSEYFVPSFFLLSDSLSTDYLLNSTFQIRDVNGRIDFCTNASAYDTSYCGENNAIESFGFSPGLYDAILFVGEGLFHFEITIQDPISFCDLKTYVLLYVEEPPLTPRMESVAIAVTAVVLLVVGLVSYVMYSFWSRSDEQKI